MSAYLLGLTFVFAILNWIAVWKPWKSLEYVAKPATMIFLITYLCQAKGPAPSAALIWFGLGLVFSLAGDIFLLLPRERFIAGLAAFLLAHVGYIIGFNIPLPGLNTFSLILAVIIGITAARVLRPILKGLAEKGLNRLRGPVLIYGVVISIMLLSAFLTLFRPEWETNAAGLVSLGAALFFISDVILAVSRFVKPIKNGRLMNMATYHLGQIALAVGMIMQFAK